jgi:CBS domain-containing protein
MRNVRELLEQKGTVIFSVQPDVTVFATLQLMAEKEIGAVLVFEADRLVGMFSERDYARQVILKGKASKDTPVRDVMTGRVTYIRPEQTVEDCMALMTDKRVRHLPVLDQGKVIGLVSIGDIVKAVISEKQFIIEQLENYISSGG